MAFQLTIDCADPVRLVRFWARALGYVPEPPPAGFDNWNAYLRDVGVPEEELSETDDACDSIVDPAGAGPRIWFQIVPEGKVVKNRLHLDIRASDGRGVPPAVRREQVEAAVRGLVAAGATRLRDTGGDGIDHYAVTLHDPEGNEFCVN